MIKLLAPTTVESVDEGATVIIEMDADTFRAIKAGVQVAFEDLVPADQVSDETQEQIWRFFVHGENQEEVS